MTTGPWTLRPVEAYTGTMSRSSDAYGARADRVRQRYSHDSIARRRRRAPADPAILAQEQAEYASRFARTDTAPSRTQMAVISDVNGNYPDQVWTRP